MTDCRLSLLYTDGGAAMFTLEDVLVATGGQLEGPELPGLTLAQVCLDSRQVRPGALFVAVKGQRHDGHDYVRRAFQAGAAAALVEHVPEDFTGDGSQGMPVVVVPDTVRALGELARYWRRKHRCQVVGVTGSVGKTTTKEVIASVLAHSFRVLKSEGNLNTELSLPLVLLQMDHTHQVAVLEMAMWDLGDIARLASIAEPQIGVVTNVLPQHLSRVGTIERVARAKSELVESLPPDGVAVLNYDDPRVRAMSAVTQARTLYYGLGREADVWANSVTSHGLRGVEFDLYAEGRKVHVRLPLLGSHSVHAALAATGVALAMGLELEAVAEGLRSASSSVRIVVTPGINGSTIIDDSYNANPESVMAALNLLSEMAGRKIAVLGDMYELGSYEEAGHRKVGNRAARIAHILITVGPRARLIADEALQCGMPHKDVHIMRSNGEAIELLTRIVLPGDHVLVKGSRGMRMEEIVEAIRVGES